MEREKIIKIKRMIITMHNTNDKWGNSNNKSQVNMIKMLIITIKAIKKIRIMRAVRIE